MGVTTDYFRGSLDWKKKTIGSELGLGFSRAPKNLRVQLTILSGLTFHQPKICHNSHKPAIEIEKLLLQPHSEKQKDLVTKLLFQRSIGLLQLAITWYLPLF